MPLGPDIINKNRQYMFQEIIGVIDAYINNSTIYDLCIDLSKYPQTLLFTNEIIEVYKQAGWSYVNIASSGDQIWMSLKK